MSRLHPRDYRRRLQGIRLIVTDVDGVLTDGSISYAGDATEIKTFHVRDGSAVYIAKVIGVPIAVVTARESESVARRFTELPVLELRQRTFDKLGAMREIGAGLGVGLDETLYLADDLVDLAAVRAAGLGVAVADAHRRLAAEADWITERAGGRGALREVVDDLVGARGLWDAVLDDYLRRQSLDPDEAESATGDGEDR